MHQQVIMVDVYTGPVLDGIDEMLMWPMGVPLKGRLLLTNHVCPHLILFPHAVLHVVRPFMTFGRQSTVYVRGQSIVKQQTS